MFFSCSSITSEVFCVSEVKPLNTSNAASCVVVSGLAKNLADSANAPLMSAKNKHGHNMVNNKKIIDSGVILSRNFGLFSL